MKRSLLLPGSLVAAALLSAAGCGGDDSGSRSPSGSSDAVPDDADEAADSGSSGSSSGRRRGSGGSRSSLERLDDEDVDSPELGGLHGTILFDGKAPERFELTASDKPECCTHPDVEHLSEGAIVNGDKVQNVFVHITRGFDEDSIPAAPTEPYRIDQRGCIYSPHVNGVQRGRKVLVRNSDPTTHNVNVRAKKNESTNKNMAKNQAPFEYDFEFAEGDIKLKCDIHPWMEARLHVTEHPWFAVTDANGGFRIPDVPPGKYTVEAVHEQFGKQRGEIEVEAGRSAGFSFTFEP